MARRGALTALQAVLAGVSGGAQGLVQQREMERKRQQEQAAQEERQAMNVASLYERGFMTPEQLAQRQQAQQGKASSTVLQGIMGALTPTAAVAPPPTARDVNALSEALATAGREPAQRLSYAGRDFVRAETPQAQEERLAGLTFERERMAAKESQRARAAEAQATQEFQRERDAAKQAFDAVQNRLDREAQTAQTAMRIAAEGGTRRPTEAQERNAVYYNLMSNAQQELETLRGNPEIRPWAITAYLNTPGAQFGRGLLSDAEQQFIRAAQDFTAGILRKETGAAATRSEVAQTLERYIEMGGEQPGSAKAKSDARQRVTDAMRISAMPALEYSRRYEAPAPAPSSAPAPRPPISSFRRP